MTSELLKGTRNSAFFQRQSVNTAVTQRLCASSIQSLKKCTVTGPFEPFCPLKHGSSDWEDQTLDKNINKGQKTPWKIYFLNTYLPHTTFLKWKIIFRVFPYVTSSAPLGFHKDHHCKGTVWRYYILSLKMLHAFFYQ